MIIEMFVSMCDEWCATRCATTKKFIADAAEELGYPYHTSIRTSSRARTPGLTAQREKKKVKRFRRWLIDIMSEPTGVANE